MPAPASSIFAEPFGVDFVILTVFFQFSQSLVEVSSQFAVFLEGKAVGFRIHGIPYDLVLVFAFLGQVVLGHGLVDNHCINALVFQFQENFRIGIEGSHLGAGNLASLVSTGGTDLYGNLLAFQVFDALYSVVVFGDHDHQTGSIIGVGEGHGLFPFIGDAHAGCGHINVAGIQGRDQSIEAHVLDLHFFAQFLADGPGQIHIEAGEFLGAFFLEFERSKGGFGPYFDHFLFLGRLFGITSAAGHSQHQSSQYAHYSRDFLHNLPSILIM